MPLNGNHVKLTTSACGAGAAEATRQWVPDCDYLAPSKKRTVYALPYKTKHNVPSSISKQFMKNRRCELSYTNAYFHRDLKWQLILVDHDHFDVDLRTGANEQDVGSVIKFW